MLRHLPLVALLSTLALAPSVRAEGGAPFQKGGKIGLGLGGSNFSSGITGKMYLSDELAVQASAGFIYGFGLSLAVDGVKEMAPLWQNGDLGINWNVGVGASMETLSGLGLGVQGLVGARLWLNQWPVELTTELRPTFWLTGGYWDTPGLGRFGLWGGGAIRYFFN